jgi:cytidylate kinase
VTKPFPRITIAIDGFSACGKSTLARRMAEELGYLYLDTGAMYRAVTLYFLQEELDWNDPDTVERALDHIYLQFITHPDDLRQEMHLNGQNVETEIRTMLVSDKVCELSALSAVRRRMVDQQRDMGRDGGVVLDGRDIGTIVFPRAELKLFVTARLDVRVDRRMAELRAKGGDIDRESVRANLLMRDREETTRADSPLLQAADALLLDTSDLDQEAVLQAALAHFERRFGAF